MTLSCHRPLKGALLSLKDKPLILKSLIYLITRIIKIVKRRRKSNIKTFGLRLNTRPYNKLSKEVDDFKD